MVEGRLLREAHKVDLTDGGETTLHSHAGGAGLGYTLFVQALSSSPTDGATTFFGSLPRIPNAASPSCKVYIRKAGTIKIVEIFCYSVTAGTAEAWSLYIRINDTTDYLIATVESATYERMFGNTGLSIAVAAGDFFVIKMVNPTWVTNPLTTVFGGYVYIE